MPDIPISLSNGNQPIAVRPVRTPPPAAITKPEGASSGRTSTDLQHRPQAQKPKSKVVFDPPKQLDGQVLTGPPPAFSTSLLEVETSLKTAIDRMTAAREMARNDVAVPVDNETHGPLQDTPVSRDQTGPRDRQA